MEATCCTNIPSAHRDWTEEVGINFINPPAVVEEVHPEFGPRRYCKECADR